jgi:hypothetical protein
VKIVDGNHIIDIASKEAKLLFNLAKYIYTDFLDYNLVCPYIPEERLAVADLWKFKIFYMAKDMDAIEDISVFGEDVTGFDGLVLLSEEQEKIAKQKYSYKILSNNILD